jgi:hypothetical protein
MGSMRGLARIRLLGNSVFGGRKYMKNKRNDGRVLAMQISSWLATPAAAKRLKAEARRARELTNRLQRARHVNRSKLMDPFTL